MMRSISIAVLTFHASILFKIVHSRIVDSYECPHVSAVNLADNLFVGRWYVINTAVGVERFGATCSYVSFARVKFKNSKIELITYRLLFNPRDHKKFS